MGKTCDQLPPSEALPGIGDHYVVFHDGKGFYYSCKEYSTSLDKRQFECVRRECRVTATMGPGQGSPLVYIDSHSHAADWGYRNKCLLLHTIRQRFLHETTPPSHILQEVLSSLSLEEEEEDEENDTENCNFESVTVDEQPAMNLFKEEPSTDQIDKENIQIPFVDPINEENDRILKELEESTFFLRPVIKTYCKSTTEERASTGEHSSTWRVENKPETELMVIKTEDCELEEPPQEFAKDIFVDPGFDPPKTKSNKKRKTMLKVREDLEPLPPKVPKESSRSSTDTQPKGHHPVLIQSTAKSSAPTRLCELCSSCQYDVHGELKPAKEADPEDPTHDKKTKLGKKQKAKKVRKRQKTGRQTRYICPECGVALCEVPCFQEWHRRQQNPTVKFVFNPLVFLSNPE